MSKDALKCLERGWSVLGLEGLSMLKKLQLKLAKKYPQKLVMTRKRVQFQFSYSFLRMRRLSNFSGELMLTENRCRTENEILKCEHVERYASTVKN